MGWYGWWGFYLTSRSLLKCLILKPLPQPLPYPPTTTYTQLFSGRIQAWLGTNQGRERGPVILSISP